MKTRLRRSDMIRSGSALFLTLVAGAASAQDQFKFGESSVGRARDDGSSRQSSRSSAPSGSSRIDSGSRNRTSIDRAPSFNRTQIGGTSRAANDSPRMDLYRGRDSDRSSDRSGGRNDRNNDRGGDRGGRSAIDPDGDGIGLSYQNRQIWDQDVLDRTRPNDRGGRNDDRHDNDHRDNDRDRHDRDWDHDRSSFRVSIGTGLWLDDCNDWPSTRYGRGCGVSTCGGCSLCSASYTFNDGWCDPWANPAPIYVYEPVIVSPPVVTYATQVVTVPVIIYATTDVSDALLAADAGAHARAISLMRAYAAQHARLPHVSELGPASRQALENVWRAYEHAALTPGANADTYFMLGACRAMRGDRDLAAAAFDAALVWGDRDPSSAALRDWCRQ